MEREQGAPVAGDASAPTARPIAPLAAGATDIGQREHNEDHVLLRPELGLFLLADGAGGHNAGNVASALATTTVANVFESSATSLASRPEIDQFGLWTAARRLSAAIHRANAEIADIAKRSEKYQGMGSTVVALAFSPAGDIVHVAHVGDSRCYRLRGGMIEALTIDHSLVADVLETHPGLDDALLARMPTHVVTRALGMEERVRVAVRSLAVAPGDVYLMCSDGLTDVIDDERLEALLSRPGTPDEHARGLVDAALAEGTEDNVAVVVVACNETDAPPQRRPSVRPHVAAPASRPHEASAPEIVIVGVETHVVPPTSVNPGLLDALGRLARLKQPSTPLADASALGLAQCATCGQPLASGATECPTCGASR